jgi:hypothetical protein
LKFSRAEGFCPPEDGFWLLVVELPDEKEEEEEE